ncbi:cupin domain-containing protein [Actinopolymorpha alba]|uniref:cupin domain-containing protein n=1 Tax=Actinopolymorpha alba TaxID=533267 RepID=UPI0012F6DCF7|nr:cupin domain-containing protein [Actinopolymorpha alba]
MTDDVVRPAGLRAGFHAHLDRAGVAGLVHAGDQQAPTSFLIRRHRHDVWELYLQLSGPATRWLVGEEEYVVDRHELLVVPPGTIHHMVCPAASEWHFLFAAFDIAPLLERFPEVADQWRRAVPRMCPARARRSRRSRPFSAKS